MRRLIWLTALVGLVATALPARADLRPEAWFATLSGMYVLNDAQTNDLSLSGGGVGLVVEKMFPQSRATLGISVGWFSASGNYAANQQGITDVDFSGVPAYLLGRWFFAMSDVSMYFGVGAGAMFSEYKATDRETGADMGSTDETNFSMVIPFGLFAFVSDSVYINFNITPQYIASHPEVESFNIGFQIGVGMQFGGKKQLTRLEREMQG